MTLLKAMSEPLIKIRDRRADMSRPVRVGILLLQPGKHFIQLSPGGCESEAVSEIQSAVTKGESLCAEQIFPAETTKAEGRTGKNSLQALLPIREQLTYQRSGTVVQPIVLKYAALGPNFPGEGLRGLGNLDWDLGM